MKYFSKIILAISISFGVQGALAANFDISQQNKTFVSTDLTVKVNDTLTFINNEDPASGLEHNIQATINGNTTEIPKQKPGEKQVLTMTTAGEMNLRCAIHPKMKLKVTVQ